MLKFYPELLQEEINFVNCDGTEFIDTRHVRGESRYARWTTPDPLADKYYSTSPYAFCNNNPVNFVDPDGRYIETIWDVVSISIGVKNLRENIKAGNVKAAIGDGVGILIDGLAAAFPVVPGGIGAARTAGRAAINAAEGAIDAAKAVDTAKDAKTVSSINDVTKSTETDLLQYMEE